MRRATGPASVTPALAAASFTAFLRASDETVAPVTASMSAVLCLIIASFISVKTLPARIGFSFDFLMSIA